MSTHTYLNEEGAIRSKEQGTFQKEQYGSFIQLGSSFEFPIQKPTIFLLGCNDLRGMEETEDGAQEVPHAQRIRDIFYTYYNWYNDIDVIDLGDIALGAVKKDSYIAIEQIMEDIIFPSSKDGNKVMTVFLGGSADQAVGMYNAYAKREQHVDYICMNSHLPILPNAKQTSDSYLLDLLVEDNSYLHFYSHLGYQSYLNSLSLLENLDKFSFENIRLGQLKERLDSVEPLFRTTTINTFDVRALAPAAYPMFHTSPTGLLAEEACRLMQFAGMSTSSNVIHLSGYDAKKDIYNYYAMTLAQMLWYAINGFSQHLDDDTPNADSINHFVVSEIEFAGYQSAFYKSKKSNRWWMLGPNKSYIPCNEEDFRQASNNRIPERWLRYINR